MLIYDRVFKLQLVKFFALSSMYFVQNFDGHRNNLNVMTKKVVT